MKQNTKILYFVTEDWFFCSHFIDRAIAAQQAGYQVSVLTRVNQHSDAILAHGFKLIDLKLERSKINLFSEFSLIKQIISIYRREKPNIVHHVALKPIIYGSFAAKMANIKAIVNAPVGLGYVFSSKQLKARLLKPLVLAAYSCFLNPKNSIVIFENPDNFSYLFNLGIVNSARSRLIRGAGVNIQQFMPSDEPETIPPIVILAARMLWDKGIGEFVEAAKIIQSQSIKARFLLVGTPDAKNPASIDPSQLVAWQEQGIIEWVDHQTDMPAIFKNCHIVCLPSYAEGLPRVLIEAAASGRPIVTTDVPGCREIVKDGKNGFLVPAKSTQALATALITLIQNPQLRIEMGTSGREMVVNNFSNEQVIRETLSVYAELVS